jgi:hypothetical protein
MVCGSSERTNLAKSIIDMLTKIIGVRNRDLFLNLSPRYPITIPPVKVPQSIIDGIYPENEVIFFSATYFGSQNSNP